MRTRLIAAVLAAATVTAGLALRQFTAGAVAKYGGVALWAALVYALVVLIAPALSLRRTAAMALAISYAVELAQLTPLPAWLSARHVLLRLIFGTTFNAPDLVAYAVGVAMAAAVHALVVRSDG